MKFHKGDKVKIIKIDDDDSRCKKVGHVDYVELPNYTPNGKWTVKLKSGLCVKPENIIKIKRWHLWHRMIRSRNERS